MLLYLLYSMSSYSQTWSFESGVMERKCDMHAGLGEGKQRKETIGKRVPFGTEREPGRLLNLPGSRTKTVETSTQVRL